MVIKIAQETGIEQQKVKKIVQMTLEEITEILATSERRRYELRNFGVFEVRIRKARKARNPRTGAEVMVKEKAVVTFRAGKEMEARIAQALAAQQDGHAAPRNETDGTGAGDKQ
jgi:DNA-binding protein HU-beta/integration host factor subunit beta